jgi:hypothetical protein
MTGTTDGKAERRNAAVMVAMSMAVMTVTASHFNRAAVRGFHAAVAVAFVASFC